MKLNITTKPVVKAKTVAKPSAKPSAKPEVTTLATGTKIKPSLIDKWSAYNAIKFPISEYAKKLVDQEIPASEEMSKGYLVTVGEKGTLVREVTHNGEIYLRGEKHYGNVSLLSDLGVGKFSAELADVTGLKKAVLKLNTVLDVRKAEDKTRHKVFLVSGHEAQYVAGLEIVGGKFVVHNMEQAASYNKKQDQYDDPKVLKLTAAQIQNELKTVK